MTYDLETLNIFIYAYFALAAASSIFAAVSVSMAIRRPLTTRRHDLTLVSGGADQDVRTAAHAA